MEPADVHFGKCSRCPGPTLSGTASAPHPLTLLPPYPQTNLTSEISSLLQDLCIFTLGPAFISFPHYTKFPQAPGPKMTQVQPSYHSGGQKSRVRFWAEIKVLEGLCSFWRLKGRICFLAFPSFWKPLRAWAPTSLVLCFCCDVSFSDSHPVHSSYKDPR